MKIHPTVLNLVNNCDYTCNFSGEEISLPTYTVFKMQRFWMSHSLEYRTVRPSIRISHAVEMSSTSLSAIPLRLETALTQAVFLLYREQE